MRFTRVKLRNVPLERFFVVHGTMADPRWLNPKVDPNDRPPGRSFLGDPKMVNMMPAGLARYSKPAKLAQPVVIN